MSRLSVIIPTRDRPVLLSNCLSALAASFPADAETIVVSDACYISIEPYVAPFVERLQLRCITAEGRGPSAARNRGLAAASGDIVLFTDDDCLPRPDWATLLASGVSLSPPRAAGGATLNGLRSNPYADAAQAVLNLVSQHDTEMSRGHRFFPSNNIAFPAASLRALGGFDESFHTAEDRELCRRWLLAGFTLQRVSEAVVEHQSNLNLYGFMRQFFAYGQGAAKFHASDHSESFRECAGFHFRLPALACSEIISRGPRRGSALAGLLVLWEIANLAGFLAGNFPPANSTPPADGAKLSKVGQ